jgi:hypothetical protein
VASGCVGDTFGTWAGHQRGLHISQVVVVGDFGDFGDVRGEANLRTYVYQIAT